MWRWDQGRLLYFQFDVLRNISKSLVKFDGVDVSHCQDVFRKTLVSETGMPFYPEHYTVKRNYLRVFQCALLAGFVNNKLIVSDICRDLANPEGNLKNADDYLFCLIGQFRFPFPAFDNYNAVEQRVYPFIAILKYLMAQRELGLEAKMSIDDIFSYIIGNGCTGLENIEKYKSLTPTQYSYTSTERRQLREMVIFFSQLSILKVYNGFLWLDEISDKVKDQIYNKCLTLNDRMAKKDRMEEFLEMTSLNKQLVIPTIEDFISEPTDIEFVEGNRKRVEHFRVERSGLLRKYYKSINPKPICRACGTDMSIRYPWTDYMLDIHHLLPLSSSVAISFSGTSLNDIVGLCPSCHRAVHMYYQKWLKSSGQDDFRSKQEAHDVFLRATKEIA